MYIYEAEGKNRAEAEENALQDLSLSREDVTFETSPNKDSGGIFGFVNKKPVAVRVYPVEGKMSVEQIMECVLLSILKNMDISATIIGTAEEEGNYVIELKSPDSGIIIGKHGRTLDAIQFLLNLLVKPKMRGEKRILIDVEKYREKRKQSLVKLSKSVAARVHRSGSSVLLDFMNPYERRIIHLALENDSRVTTRSDGNGVYKRLRVLPNLPDDEQPPELSEGGDYAYADEAEDNYPDQEE